jgi:hypothetical protein
MGKKLSVGVNFVFGELYSDEILIMFRRLRLGGSSDVNVGRIALEASDAMCVCRVWVTNQHVSTEEKARKTFYLTGRRPSRRMLTSSQKSGVRIRKIKRQSTPLHLFIYKMNLKELLCRGFRVLCFGCITNGSINKKCRVL